MNTPTPRTDAAFVADREPWSFADELERELAETKQQNHRLATGETLRGIREYALGLDQELREATSAVERLMDSEAKLLAERDKLRKALILAEAYMAHAPICRDESVERCDCGLAEAQAQINAALATEEEK